MEVCAEAVDEPLGARWGDEGMEVCEGTGRRDGDPGWGCLGEDDARIEGLV
jgi:hypothetical protein